MEEGNAWAQWSKKLKIRRRVSSKTRSSIFSKSCQRVPQPWTSCKQLVEKTAKIAFRFDLEDRSKNRPKNVKNLSKFAKKTYRNAVPLQRKRNSPENTWNHPNLTKNNRFGGPKGVPFGENFVTNWWLFGSLRRFGCALDKKSAGERFPCRFLVDFWLIFDRFLIDFCSNVAQFC